MEALLQEFAASGLRQREFCAGHGVGLSTLGHYLRRSRVEMAGVLAPRLIAVELHRADSGMAGSCERQAEPGTAPPSSRPSMECEADSGLAVVLRGGRRIEVHRGFDAEVLEQVVCILERT